MQGLNATGLDIRDGANFRDHYRHGKRLAESTGCPVLEPIDSSQLAESNIRGGLGTFTATYKGGLVVSPGGEFDFIGALTFHDRWDFNSGNRPADAEPRTRIAGALMPGTPFNIDSKPYNVHLSDRNPDPHMPQTGILFNPHLTVVQIVLAFGRGVWKAVTF